MRWYKLKTFFRSLGNTPLHPQWFALKQDRVLTKELATRLGGRVLDVGCGRQMVRSVLDARTEYVGLDYYQTATEWYKTSPQVFGDAQRLPIRDGCLDYVLLLDVLEHLPDPETAIQEIFRVLKPRGQAVLQVPFMYPIHDAPLDFHRWTIHGLRALAGRHGFTVDAEKAVGGPLEGAALLFNIACSKAVLSWARRGNPLALLIFVLPVLVPLSNVAAWLLTWLSPKDTFMPFAYSVIWTKVE